ncbi:MAG: CAP domain-containing protein, partial [Actinomycetia bacterium]|nr:CAP domain-containing protein [Actinomycetes bacterium]
SRAATSQAILPNTPVNFTSLEAEILSLINSTRAAHGLSALSANQMLTDLARLRSNDMISRNYFSHHTPDGKNIKHIFSDYGVVYKNFGENLGNASPAGYGSPKAFLNAWMDSPGHRDNMLRSNYSLIGVGVTDGGGRRVVTVLFIR